MTLPTVILIFLMNLIGDHVKVDVKMSERQGYKSISRFKQIFYDNKFISLNSSDFTLISLEMSDFVPLFLQLINLKLI